MVNLTYGILGTGALGGFYGAKLQKSGLPVNFLVRSDYQHIVEHGLMIESIDGNFHLPKINAYIDVDKKMPRCDVVIIAMKTTQNYQLPQILPSLVKDDGVVLVLQNGLGMETEVAKIVGNERVIGGLSFLTANKIAPGHIRHLSYKNIILGGFAANYQLVEINSRMQQIASDFENAGIPMELTTDLLLARWKKLVWNIPYNGLSVILNASTAELMADMHTRELVEKIMNEVVLAAEICGREIPHSFVQLMLGNTAKMPSYQPSMKIDFDECRPLEVEAIFGNPLRITSTFDAHVSDKLPLINCLYQQLKFLDTKNRDRI
ncbi:putative 2-dehydropantoate 2-reductase [Calothrix sp. UHCC 0171]|uniref:putative 2-dehydropantoate 2-reductase n=1 Tax=Calothrix sp. UHCC 0171 TaxID=3110245 RepID=UPI002B21A0FF|nr:putative 2-dehydropantoate 2-reductase [Calothrix sp. UHCC 0171]MEA5569902.1 putative 2-dehydropantoate 2-reductase [Calothrix sp. UHCC 0171]